MHKDEEGGKGWGWAWGWGGFIGGVLPTYWIQDDFTTADGAPVTSPRACEPYGTMTLDQTVANFAIAGDDLVWTVPGAPAWGGMNGTRWTTVGTQSPGPSAYRTNGNAKLRQMGSSGSGGTLIPRLRIRTLERT